MGPGPVAPDGLVVVGLRKTRPSEILAPEGHYRLEAQAALGGHALECSRTRGPVDEVGFDGDERPGRLPLNPCGPSEEAGPDANPCLPGCPCRRADAGRPWTSGISALEGRVGC